MDVTQKLENRGLYDNGYRLNDFDVADEIKRIRAENARLREALTRLARLGEHTTIDLGLVKLIAKNALE